MAIRTARERSGLGVRELARRAGTSHATLSAYEHGRKVPRVDTMIDIVRAAGFEIDIALARRADLDRRRKGEELVEALILASQFPARHRRRLGPTRFTQR